MGILLKKLRVHGFRGLDNIEIDFESTSVLVGVNNAGKTTLLKSLQLALSNSLQISDDDFFYSDTINRDKIIIDVLFISVDENNIQTSEFEDKWGTIITENRISFDSDGNQILAFRTEIKENLMAQLTAPVKWTQCIQAMIADGGTEFVEVGPGKVLQGLMRKIDRSVAASGASIDA